MNQGKSSHRRKTCCVIPTSWRQLRTWHRQIILRFMNMAFQFADKAMYLLGPVLIVLATAIITGLTWLYFMIVLPMLTGTNWISTQADWKSYWTKHEERENNSAEHANAIDNTDDLIPVSKLTPTLLALLTPVGIFHTSVVLFFLSNILYNYYYCVSTSNNGPSYDIVVRQLAIVTGFNYPETDEELIDCRRRFERKIYERVQRKNAEQASNTSCSHDFVQISNPSINSIESNRNNYIGDIESQTTSADNIDRNNSIKVLPKIHNWQLLSPIEWGFCRYSSLPKPPRSHYDHVTKHLVLNMDHYCPWMFNCIGYFNYRYFFNFLFFVSLALWYGAAICYPAFMMIGGQEYKNQLRASGGFQKPSKDLIVHHLTSNSFIPTPGERTPIALGFMMCLCLAAAVTGLCGFHLYLVLSAQTTIEFHGNLGKRRKSGWNNPYSTGNWKKNWELIYGTDTNVDEDDRSRRRIGFFTLLKGMMPSNREPEFLPFPIGGTLIRRNLVCHDVEKVNREGLSEDKMAIGPDILLASKNTRGVLTGRRVNSSSIVV